MKLIAQGAEAKIYLFIVDGKKYIAKKRCSKEYRLKEIDEKLKKYRFRREFSMLRKASQIIPAPWPSDASSETDTTIIMELIEGKKVAEILDTLDEKKRINVCKEIGKNVALLHNADIIHGDLTTSNMILTKEKLFFIDFGLSFIDSHPEHKAVDLHLLKQALESKHWKHFDSSFKAVLESYQKNAKEGKEIINRFEIVELRGRYKRKGS
ncbi:MAG: KEOPS complex kinase/ATPase Bud32 [Candidatus Nanoarchaeia archaeon]